MQTVTLPYAQLVDGLHAEWFGPFAVSARTFVYPDQPHLPGRLQLAFNAPPRHVPTVLRFGTTRKEDVVPGNPGECAILAPGGAIRLAKSVYQVWVRLLPGDGTIADLASGQLYQVAANAGAITDTQAQRLNWPDEDSASAVYQQGRWASGSKQFGTVQLYALDEGEDWQSGRVTDPDDLILPAIAQAGTREGTDAAYTASATLGMLLPHRHLTAYELRQYRSAVLRLQVSPYVADLTVVSPVTVVLPDTGYTDGHNLGRRYLIGNNYGVTAQNQAEICLGSPSSLAKRANGATTNLGGQFIIGTQASVIRAVWELSKREHPEGVLDSSLYWAGGAVVIGASTQGTWAALPADKNTLNTCLTVATATVAAGGTMYAGTSLASGSAFPPGTARVHAMSTNGAGYATTGTALASNVIASHNVAINGTSRCDGANVFFTSHGGAGTWNFSRITGRSFRQS